jgi:LmbE family N-acetylglucosaminyl deacetylase
MATILAFHAHPDDEVLLTGGTIARSAAAGHRVVIVVATDGVVGAVPDGGSPRLDELRASASILGAARVVHLGYADRGHGEILFPDPPDRTRFVRAPTEEAAGRLAAILREEDADVLLSYDSNGGYGHRDHVKVHEVGRRAAELTDVPRVLEATMPRNMAIRLVGFFRLFGFGSPNLEAVYSPGTAITRSIVVRRFARQKRAALAAHRSPLAGDGNSASLFRVLVSLPVPLFAVVLGREWYIEARSKPSRKEDR